MEKPQPIGKPKITEVKDGMKIREATPDNTVIEWTCKKCGSHSYALLAASEGKRAGVGMSASRLKVCRNCGWAEENLAERNGPSWGGIS